jgi:hypothetical protein
MNIQKIADAAFFVPAYSEQTIAWYPMGYTFQGFASGEICEKTEPVQSPQVEPFFKGGVEQGPERASGKGSLCVGGEEGTAKD